jgi:polyferredoxin
LPLPEGVGVYKNGGLVMFHIKTNRTFTHIRRYGFVFTLAVAIGGLWYPKIGLLVLPVMIGLMLTSFFKGRYWCGNICAHGSLFDSVIIKASRNKNIPKPFKSKYLYIPFFLYFGFKIVRGLMRVSMIYGSASYFDRMGFIFVSSYIMVTLIGGTVGLIFAPRTWCNFCPMGVL